MERLSQVAGHLGSDPAQLPPAAGHGASGHFGLPLRLGLAAGGSPSDIFDMAAPCVAAFSQAQFEADGFYVWDSVMLPACRRQLTAALQDIQRIQDEFVMDDRWSSGGVSAFDYAALGLSPPSKAFARDERQGMVGSSQGGGQQLAAGIEPLDEAERQACLTPHPVTGSPDPLLMRETKYRQRMPIGKWGGVMPEHFPAGYSDHVLDMVIHPQMLDLHRMMIGDELRYDHVVALNRKGGFAGQGWHSHGYVEDNEPPTARLPELGLVRTLAYPEGFSATNDGGIKVVRGSGLHRCNGLSFPDDATLRKDWMDERRNPATGAPLEIVAGALPPGSMVSIACHTLHGVSPRVPRGDTARDGYLHADSTRWCALFSFRNPDPQMVETPTSRGIPEPFRLAVQRGEVAACDTEEKRKLFEPY